jgi:glutamate:Na+ symporter, ESS family
MQSPFPFHSILLFGFLAILLLIGVVLRARVPFFQRFLFPSCLIGGVLGLILVNTGLVHFSAYGLESFAYHLFNISFISVGLTRGRDEHNTSGHKKEVVKGSLWMALTQGVTFPLQAAIGGLAVLFFSLFGLKLFPTFGFLMPLGFNEGPGQALSFGKVWETVGFNHAATLGLGFAAVGYFFAFFVGVPLVNHWIRKGPSAQGTRALSRDFMVGITVRDQKRESAGELTLHSANTDSLAFQAALVGLVYVLTYFFVKYFGKVLPPDAGKMLWGFFFFFGLGLALCVRWLMEKMGLEYLVDRGIQRRITGLSVDFLIVATVAAIQVLVVWTYIVPFLTISLASGVFTTLVVLFLGKRLPSYNLERTVAIYGTVTGTVSCGLLLLRIADPEFQTPVALEMAIMNVFVVPIVGGCTVLVNGPLWWHWSTAFTVLVFAVIMAASLTVIKILGLWTKPPLHSSRH